MTNTKKQMEAREIHTTHLLTACQRRVKLTLEGKVSTEVGCALYRGVMFHEAIRSLLGYDPTGTPTLSLVASVAASRTIEQFASEGKKPSPSAKAASSETIGECTEMLFMFQKTLGPELEGAKIIGQEIPIRWTIDVDGEPVDFASHLDFLFRDHHGVLNLWDFKSNEESPSWAYLNRNIQLGMYWGAIRYGSIKIGDDWVEMEEWPNVAWVHLNHLFPFGRKTKMKDDDGNEVEYVKGDTRPLKSVIRHCDFNDEKFDVLLAEFETRVRMRRLGMFPMQADPIGCNICECKSWCVGFGGDGK